MYCFKLKIINKQHSYTYIYTLTQRVIHRILLLQRLFCILMILDRDMQTTCCNLSNALSPSEMSLVEAPLWTYLLEFHGIRQTYKKAYTQRQLTGLFIICQPDILSPSTLKLYIVEVITITLVQSSSPLPSPYNKERHAQLYLAKKEHQSCLCYIP